MIELLDDPAKSETASRLLERYTRTSKSVKQWRAWFAENKERIFFSDVGGYRFFVTPEGYPVGQKNQTRIGKELFR